MIHYLILAHKGPKQLEKLIGVLSGENNRVYLHLDAKSNDVSLLSFEKVEYITPRTHIEWGGYSMVRATINSMRQILFHMQEGDHLVIMSGQDFPIISQKQIADFLEENKNKSFLEYRIQPNGEWNILNRVIKYHFHDLKIPTILDNLIKKIISPFYPVHIIRNQAFCYIWQRIINFFLPVKTYLIQNYRLYWGSSWMVLSWEHISYVMDFLETKEGKKFIHAFLTVAGPDELFFQTLLLNSPYADAVENNLLWYIDWHTGPGLPRIFDSSDFDTLLASGKLFARKFDEGVSDTVIDSIIKNL